MANEKYEYGCYIHEENVLSDPRFAEESSVRDTISYKTYFYNIYSISQTVPQKYWLASGS